MKKVVIVLGLAIMLLVPMIASAVQVAPRITDKEIIERLTRLEEGQKALNKRIVICYSGCLVFLLPFL